MSKYAIDELVRVNVLKPFKRISDLFVIKTYKISAIRLL